QIEKTGTAFAVDMLLAKFVQGLPVVGVLGGVGNPVCYNRVMRYVHLKYRKRYLLTVAKRKGFTL
ncbi:MAG: EcsC family protein, partial [Eubacteriales bacterium]|nr:EcsC family protein [Eubacteriales bacterium]